MATDIFFYVGLSTAPGAETTRQATDIDFVATE